jgi:acyl-CoA thioesterase YciA
MDLAGGTCAAAHSGKRVVMARIDAVEFLKPVLVGDDVSVFCALAREGDTSITVAIEVWARDRTGDAPRKVTKGMFSYVAVDKDGEPATVS